MNLIAEGGHRRVFEHPDNPNWVIKIAENPHYNRTEMETWKLASELGLDDWLIPCIEISEDGKTLIQERGETVKEVPKDIPDWLKPDSNIARQWKLHKGKIKKCDYDHNERGLLENYQPMSDSKR